MSVRVQPESWDDSDGVRAVHLAAFPTPAEADLVAKLHAAFASEISLVAKDEGRVVGHALLSRMTAEGDGRAFRAVGLGPVAVLPERQRGGIGSALIEKALRQAEAAGEELVFVVGDPDYYRRFGFSAEAAAPFRSPYAGRHFMARAFGVAVPDAGRADYAAAFGELGV